jgi:hypothetical protein
VFKLGLPGQDPPTATLRMMKLGPESNGHAAPVELFRVAGVKVA